jgi:site-specific DNA-methyltransferase (adenine-specific)
MTGEYYNIDCMELMAKYPDKHFDLAIVDPPYGINIGTEIDRSRFRPNSSGNSFVKYEAQMKDKQWDKQIPDQSYFNELFRVSKNQIIWGGNYFIEHLKKTRCFIVWDKQVFVPTMSRIELAYTSFKKHSQIFICPSAQNNRFHATQKPVKLYEWILMKYAKPTDLILDTHVGSASSLIACESTGNTYVGCELDKDYYETSLKRLEDHCKQQKLF